ncbi:hypothetical protein WDW89_08510, partial [Deltaproteobacteria bacterium TL4]
MQSDSNPLEESTSKRFWSRSEIVANVIDFEQRTRELSQRQWCQENDVPRSTLQNWLARKDNIESDID